MIDPALFKIRFPEFVAVSDDRIQLFIDDSVIALNPTYWGNKYDLGLYYYTAHLLTDSKKTEAGSITPKGPLASKSVDGVSTGYTNATPASGVDAWGESDIYGQRYLALRKTLGVPAYAI